MSKPKKPKHEFEPMYSQNFLVSFSWVHYAVERFTEAFKAGAK